MRKVYVEIKVRAIIEMEEGIEVSEVIADMDYDMTAQTDGASIADTEIMEYNIVDSK